MPIYEFQCESCDLTFEKLTFKGDEGHIGCPECGTRNVKRLLSPTSIMGGSGLGACAPNTSSGFS